MNAQFSVTLEKHLDHDNTQFESRFSQLVEV